MRHRIREHTIRPLCPLPTRIGMHYPELHVLPIRPHRHHLHRGHSDRVQGCARTELLSPQTH
jgi:hypothetical protein